MDNQLSVKKISAAGNTARTETSALYEGLGRPVWELLFHATSAQTCNLLTRINYVHAGRFSARELAGSASNTVADTGYAVFSGDFNAADGTKLREVRTVSGTARLYDPALGRWLSQDPMADTC